MSLGRVPLLGPNTEAREIHDNQGMDYRDIATIEADKRGGKVCIRGLRITVEDVLSWLGSGMTEDEIISDYPDLTREDIRAAIAYAVDHELGFRVEPELRAVLLEAMAQCDRGEKISGDELLEELRRNESRLDD